MNRKHITYSEYYESNGEIYSINVTKKSGCYTPILKSGITQLNACYEKWGRMFVYFIGLHQADKTDDSKHVTRLLRDKLRYHLKKRYGIDQAGYLWVRETEKAKSQHYHLMIVLDGDKIQHSQALALLLKQLWESEQGHTISYVKNSFYKVSNRETLEQAVHRLSYLAKERGKGYRLPQAKDYASSRLKLPFK